MTDARQLPPLPEAGKVFREPPAFYKDEWKNHKFYTANQMRAYAIAAIDASLSEAPAEPVAWRLDWAPQHSVGAPRFFGADDEHRMRNHMAFAVEPKPVAVALYAAQPPTTPGAATTARPNDKETSAPHEPLSGWQPIETAPRGSGEDGPNDTRHADYVQPPKLLLWTTEGAIVGYFDWYYHEGYGRGAEPGVSAWRDSAGCQAYGPTHWMPLPPAPVDGSAP